MTVILVTGVSAGNSREPDRLVLEEYIRKPVVLFDPDRYMKKPLLAKVSSITPWTAKAYDVADYLLLRDSAKEVDRHFGRMVEKYQPVEIWGHSLGSVVAASWLSKGNKVGKFYSLGSPLWMPVWWMVDRKAVTKACKWINVWSPIDPIAMMPIKEAFNIQVNASHPIQNYLKVNT